MKFDFSSENFQILDSTLRDGSYVVDFQFTAADTENLTKALDALGIPFIEVGHGVGINASTTKGRAACSDIEYVQAARRGAQNAGVGMFCIPGIARLDDMRACVDAGLQFIRIGVNVDDVELTKPFIQLAKKLGLQVCSNFMKSYAMAPEKFAKVVKTSTDFGSDLIYLVDSAGGMLPDEVREYVETMRSATELPIGFHGHNNLNLAVANSLTALQSGASLVDTTLFGFGRCSGNAPTEIMIILMQRCLGVCHQLNPILFMDLAERTILVAPEKVNRACI